MLVCRGLLCQQPTTATIRMSDRRRNTLTCDNVVARVCVRCELCVCVCARCCHPPPHPAAASLTPSVTWWLIDCLYTCALFLRFDVRTRSDWAVQICRWRVNECFSYVVGDMLCLSIRFFVCINDDCVCGPCLCFSVGTNGSTLLVI